VSSLAIGTSFISGPSATGPEVKVEGPQGYHEGPERPLEGTATGAGKPAAGS
jgi:hypothetical protein